MESQHPRILFRILTACLPAFVLSSACDAPEPTSSAAVVRDSAGIQIVGNPDLPAEALTTWRVEPEPLVRIGMVEGPEAQLLSGVTGAARLSDGRVVVLDGMAVELRYFDSDGSHLETVGGRGDGPGEFQSATELRRIAGDTILVRDSWLQRTSWFAPDGDLIHTLRTSRDRWAGVFGAEYVTDVHSILPDGSLLLRVRPAQARAPLGWNRPPLGLAHAHRENLDRVDTLGWYRALGHYNVGSQDDPLMRSVPWFARNTHVAAGGDPMRIYIGAMEETAGEEAAGYDVRVYRPDGTLERIVRHLVPARGAREEEIEEMRRSLRSSFEGSPGERPEGWIEEQVNSTPAPETVPPHAEIEVDAAGNLWVREWNVQLSERRGYLVFDPAGHLMGEVELPEGFRVMDIGQDYVLGVLWSEEGVQVVQLHRLDKEGG